MQLLFNALNSVMVNLTSIQLEEASFTYMN